MHPEDGPLEDYPSVHQGMKFIFETYVKKEVPIYDPSNISYEGGGGNIWWNLLFATLVFFLGGLGILITRIAKGNWANVKWSYLPIFWFPVLSSWPVSISVLLGHFDQ